MAKFDNASFFDRAVLAVSPARGLDRIQAKVRASILMNYDAGGNGPRLKGFKAPGTDADAAALASLPKMRQRARDLIRNAPFARRAQSVVTNNVIGSGIIPAIGGANKSEVRRAGDLILPYLASSRLDVHGALNLSAMQAVVMNAVFESGEVLAVRRMRPAVDQAPGELPLAIELLEIDHLNDRIFTHGGNEVRGGIEYDAGGVIVAYHIFDQHPGSASRKIKLTSRRVPAADVLHIRRIERPGQTRGIPWLAPVMVTLGELRDYQEAQILKQKISALLAGVVEAGDDGIPKGSSGLDALAPGSLVYTEAGQKVNFTNPPRVDDYEVVMRLGLSAVAVGVGITYESLSGDLGRVNFSSARVGRLEMDKNVEAWQTQIMISQFCEGVARWVLDAYRLVQTGPRRAPLSMSWTAQRRAIIDPTKEIPALIKKIEAGLSSLQREQRALGLDPEVIARERDEDAARADASAKARADRLGAAPPAPDGGDPPPDDAAPQPDKKGKSA